MNKLEAALILFCTLFVVVLLCDYYLVNKRYLKKVKKKKKHNELTEVFYLKTKFKLDERKLNTNKIMVIISCINAFIISLVSVVVILIRINIILQLLIGFVLLIALIYSIYEIFGRLLVKKGYSK